MGLFKKTEDKAYNSVFKKKRRKRRWINIFC